jgi:hypothetical protein
MIISNKIKSGRSTCAVDRARGPFAAARTLYPCSLNIPINRRKFSGVSSTTKILAFMLGVLEYWRNGVVENWSNEEFPTLQHSNTPTLQHLFCFLN